MSKPKEGTEVDETILQPDAPKGDEIVDIVGGKAKGLIVDLTQGVKVKITEKAPYHKHLKPGTEITVAPLVAEKMKINGWAK